MIQQLFYFLSALLGFYSLIIFIRIILTWFNGASFGRPYEYLCKITDPYLFWFRRFRFFNIGAIDLSPIIALALLSVASNTLISFAETGRITAGFVLAMFFSIVWSAVSFIMGFYIVILILRLIAYCINADIYAPFWHIIDYISRPVMYRVTRIFFRKRVVNYLASIIVSIASFLGMFIVFNIIARFAGIFLKNLPF